MPSSMHSAANFSSNSTTEAFSRLVKENAFDEAHDLLMSLDADKFGQLVEEIGASLHAQGVELPDWNALSEYELDMIANGAFHLHDGKVCVLSQ